jgi:hypothetical protein
MSTTNRLRLRRETSSVGDAFAAAETSNGHAGQVGDGIAFLEMLAAQMHARGWTAYINTPAGRLTSLFVQDPHNRAECGDIIAASGGPAGDWWYWFSWAERIAPVQAPAAAADAIIRAFERPADAPPVPHPPEAEGQAAAGWVSSERWPGMI